MRAVSHYGMPYCERHNRLFPHPFVGWLTPHGIAGLALVPARCDVCAKERGEDRLCHGLYGDVPKATRALAWHALVCQHVLRILKPA